MKAFVEKKAQYVLSEGFCQKVHVLIKKMSVDHHYSQQNTPIFFIRSTAI